MRAVKACPKDNRDKTRNRRIEATLPYCWGALGLDIGCGRNKSHPKAVGIDRNPFVAPDLVCNGGRLPYPDGSVDFVTALYAVEYFWNTEAAVREWLRVLRPGGHLAMILYDRRFLPPLHIGHPERDAGFRHTYSPKEFLALLDAIPGIWVVQIDTIRDGHSFDTVCRKGDVPARAPSFTASERTRSLARCLRKVLGAAGRDPAKHGRRLSR